MSESEITKVPKGTLRRIAKELIPEVRITKSALERLQGVVTEFARMTITDAEKLAEHRGQKTINEKDIILSAE